jgi:hypothetical protein
LEQREQVEGDHRPLAGGQVAAHHVLRDDPPHRVVALELDEAGLDPGEWARLEPVLAVEDLAVEQHDGVAQTVPGDVGGELSQLLVAHLREEQAGGVELFHCVSASLRDDAQTVSHASRFQSEASSTLSPLQPGLSRPAPSSWTSPGTSAPSRSR